MDNRSLSCCGKEIYMVALKTAIFKTMVCTAYILMAPEGFQIQEQTPVIISSCAAMLFIIIFFLLFTLNRKKSVQ